MAFKNETNRAFGNFTGSLSANNDTLFFNSCMATITLTFTTTTGNGQYNWVKTLEPGNGFVHRAPVNLAGVTVTTDVHHTGIAAETPYVARDNNDDDIGLDNNNLIPRVIAAVLTGGLN